MSSQINKYLSEMVVYGGEWVSRGRMIIDLQEKAKLVYPNDKHAQARLISSYLSGHATKKGERSGNR